jgi:hypothetical protein
MIFLCIKYVTAKLKVSRKHEMEPNVQSITTELESAVKVELCYFKNPGSVLATIADRKEIESILARLQEGIKDPPIGILPAWCLSFLMPNQEKIRIAIYPYGWYVMNAKKYPGSFKDPKKRLYKYVENLMEKQVKK